MRRGFKRLATLAVPASAAWPYHFANLSEDIKRLFCSSLDALGVRWTRPCDRQIAIYRKDSVAMLDRFIGAKS